jgi:hypothetical protein
MRESFIMFSVPLQHEGKECVEDFCLDVPGPRRGAKNEKQKEMSRHR